MLEESLICILTESGDKAGAGLLLEEGRILTCAHVVNQVLGYPVKRTERPANPTGLRVRLNSGGELRATLDPESWNGPPARRAPGADSCLLVLQGGSPPGAKPASLLMTPALSQQEFRAGGYPEGWDVDYAKGSIIGRDDEGLWLLRPDLVLPRSWLQSSERKAGEIAPGFSGGPVEVQGEIVGMIMEVRPAAHDATAYMMPVAQFPVAVQRQARKFENRVVQRFPHVESVKDWVAGTSGNVNFDARVRLCESFSEAFAIQRAPMQDYSETDLTPARLVARLRARQDAQGEPLSKVLILAAGGAGKSSFASRLMVIAPSQDMVPFYLDFSKADRAIDSDEPDTLRLLQKWFNACGGQGPPSALLEFTKSPEKFSGMRALFVIDGINQLKLEWDKFLQRIDAMGQQSLSGSAIVVADRMIDRAKHKGFRRAAVPPLSQHTSSSTLEQHLPDVQAVVDEPGWSAILSSPLFLQILLESAEGTGSLPSGQMPTRYLLLRRYFQQRCHLSEPELAVLADAALALYRKVRSTNFAREDLVSALGSATSFAHRCDARYEPNIPLLVSRLEEQGIVNALPSDRLEFRHQILHDWLAALRLASCGEAEESWLLRAEGFKALSLHAASSDALELALEALQEADDLVTKLSGRREPVTPRQLITELYDWNTWITVQCVISLDRRAPGKPVIPGWMRHALYALSLEKAFDLFLHTSQRARRKRAEIPQDADVPYRGCANHADLVARVVEVLAPYGDDDTTGGSGSPKEAADCRAWRALYGRTSLDTASLECIWHDPLLGWTTANLSQRVGIEPAIAKELMRLYQISRATSDDVARARGFRWRIVHALGRAEASLVADFVLNVALDATEDMHVSYGALRSAIQLAALTDSEEVTRHVLGRIESELPALFDRPPAMRQLLRRCCALNPDCTQPSATARENWRTIALPAYQGLLSRGAAIARENYKSEEHTYWEEWAAAIARLRALGPSSTSEDHVTLFRGSRIDEDMV